MERFIERTRSDVLCLQETKAPRLRPEATDTFQRLGYHVTHVGSDSYNGVAIASTTPPRDILCSGDFGDNALDREPRVAAALLPASPRLRVTSVYAPHGRHVEHWHYHYKLAFFDALTNCVSDWLRDDGHLVGGW